MTVKQGTVIAVSRNDTHEFTKPARDEIVLVAGVGVAGDAHAGVHVKHRSRVRADPTQPNLRQVHLIQQELLGEVGEKGYRVAPGNLGENVTTSGIDLLALPRGTILRFGHPSRPGSAPEPEPDGQPQAQSRLHGAVSGPLAGGDGGAQGETSVRSAESGLRPLAAVLAAAAAATLDGPTAASASAVEAAAERDGGDDPRPAVIVAGLRNPCEQINGFRHGLLKEVLGRDDEGRMVRKAGVMGVVLRGGPIRPGDPVTVELPPPPHTALDRV
jgi:MOSC domain-containing protein YiiM